MYIKIARPWPERGGARPINWLTIEATRFDHEMIHRKDLEMRKPLVESATHMILQGRAEQEGLKTTLDEVCVLKIHAPEFVVVLFDTTAYITNDKGDTIEKIEPRHDVVPDDGYEHVGYGHFVRTEGPSIEKRKRGTRKTKPKKN